jgi:hypothetical protein
MHHRVLPLPARLQDAPSHFFVSKTCCTAYVALGGQKWPNVLFSARNPLKNPILGIFRQLCDHKSIMNDIILFAPCQEKILKYIALFDIFII